MKSNRLLVVSLFGAVVWTGSPAVAATLTVKFYADVTRVDDPSNVLGGSVIVGHVIDGAYTYNTATPDSESDPRIGFYLQSVPPNGIIVNAGAFVFRTDPAGAYSNVLALNSSPQ